MTIVTIAGKEHKLRTLASFEGNRVAADHYMQAELCQLGSISVPLCLKSTEDHGSSEEEAAKIIAEWANFARQIEKPLGKKYNICIAGIFAAPFGIIAGCGLENFHNPIVKGFAFAIETFSILGLFAAAAGSYACHFYKTPYTYYAEKLEKAAHKLDPVRYLPSTTSPTYLVRHTL